MNKDKKKFIIDKLKVHEVSLVHAPANPEAKVVLYKSSDENNLFDKIKNSYGILRSKDLFKSSEEISKMNLEELKKALEDAQKQNEQLESTNKGLAEKNSTLETEVSEVKKSLEDLEKKMKEKDCAMDEKKKKEMMDEEMKKSLNPEALAQIEELKKQAAEGVAAKREVELMRLEKQAESEFPYLPGTAIEKALLLKSVNELPEEQKGCMEKILKASNEAMKENFTEIGKAGGKTGDTPDEQMYEMVKKYASDKSVSEVDAEYYLSKNSEEYKKLYAKANKIEI